MGELPRIKHELGEVTSKNVVQLQKMLEATFPIQYSPEHYERIEAYKTYTRFAFVADMAVGAISARVEDQDPAHGNKKRLYLMTLSVLPAYRRRGLANAMMEFLEAALLERLKKEDKDVVEIACHVHVDNKLAMDFYSKLGYENVGKIEGYFPTLDVKDAFLFSKKVDKLEKK